MKKNPRTVETVGNHHDMSSGTIMAATSLCVSLEKTFQLIEPEVTLFTVICSTGRLIPEGVNLLPEQSISTMTLGSVLMDPYSVE